MTVESMSDVDSDQAPDFRRLVLEAWQGEVYGTEVDGALVDRLRVSEASAKTRELTVLEEHMERQLAHLMERLGIEPDLGDTLVVADQDIRDQGSSTWHELLPTGDGQTDRVVNNVLAHERALIAFCATELVGGGDSLAEFRALLSEDDS